MSKEQRKMALISWIIQLDSDTALQQLEAMKNDFSSEEELPSPILTLLNASASTPPEDFIAHTSARDILNGINGKK